jgi:hypothetical protein
MLDPGKPSFTPKKGKASVVMFVGLQGTLFIRLLSCLLDHPAIVLYNLIHIINEIVLWEVGVLHMLVDSWDQKHFVLFCFI